MSPEFTIKSKSRILLTRVLLEDFMVSFLPSQSKTFKHSIISFSEWRTSIHILTECKVHSSADEKSKILNKGFTLALLNNYLFYIFKPNGRRSERRFLNFLSDFCQGFGEEIHQQAVKNDEKNYERIVNRHNLKMRFLQKWVSTCHACKDSERLKMERFAGRIGKRVYRLHSII